MFGLSTKSLVIGLAVGYFILPRVTAPIIGTVTGAFSKVAE